MTNSRLFRVLISTIIVLVVMFSISLPAIAEGLVGPSLESATACLIEASTGEVLFAKDAEKPLPLASISKIMTMLLVMEAKDEGRIKLTDKVTASDNATSKGGSQIFLEPGEVMDVQTLLKSVAVASANDACVALAEYVAGSEEGFVDKMNARAKALGMKNTHFVNTNGLPPDDRNTEGNVSSAHDIALMSRELMLKHPEITKFLTIWMEPIRDGKFVLTNTNKLVRFYRGADGVKTGYTVEAKHCLSASAVRDGVRMISVVMAAPSSKVRFAEASKLMDLGFAHFKAEKLFDKGKTIGNIRVYKGLTDSVSYKTESDLSVIMRKDDSGKATSRIKVVASLTAPVTKGQKVGTIEAVKNGKTVASVNLLSASEVKKAGFFKVLVDTIRQGVRSPFKAKAPAKATKP